MTIETDIRTAALQITEARDQIIADAQVLYDIVHGPATGVTSLVDTDGGPVKTAARAINEMLSSLAALSDGTALAPALAFSADPDTGLYRVGDNQFGVAAGGALVALFSSAGIELSAGMVVAGLTDPTDAQDAATKSYVDAAVAFGGSGLPLRWIKTAAGGETSASGLDDNAVSLTYIPGAEQVFVNGVILVPSVDYAATTGSTITGLSALTAGDVLQVECYTIGPPENATLAALGAYDTNGLITQTASGTFAGRTITGTAAEITVSNGNGVAGNPTLSLPSAMTLTGKTLTGGTYANPAAITGLPDPTNAQDAATKAYVLAAVAGAGDMVSTNNLSDVSSPIAALDNLTTNGSDVASASTIDLDAATGDMVDVTGTTAITAVTLAAGSMRWVRFTGALLLTHGASLILPTTANIATEAGDVAVFRGYAAGVVRCVSYVRASGEALVGGGGSASLASAHVTRSTTQWIANATTTEVLWDTESWDTDTLHSTSVETGRMTAATAGKYVAVASIVFASNNTGIRQVMIYKNDALWTTQIFPNNAAGEDQCIVTTVVNLGVGDFIDVRVYQASGGALNLQTTSSFAAAKIDN